MTPEAIAAAVRGPLDTTMREIVGRIVSGFSPGQDHPLGFTGPQNRPIGRWIVDQRAMVRVHTVLQRPEGAKAATGVRKLGGLTPSLEPAVSLLESA